MAGKSPRKHWKTVDLKSTGQLKRLEKKQADLLKLLSKQHTELEGYLIKKKTKKCLSMLLRDV